MMAIAVLVLLATYLGLAAWLGLWAERRFSRHATLPMQWWLDGRPTWSLPRRPALILFAVLSTIPLLASLLAVLTPRTPSDLSSLSEGQTLWFLVGMAAVGMGLFAFYLWLVALWVRANP